MDLSFKYKIHHYILGSDIGIIFSQITDGPFEDDEIERIQNEVKQVFGIDDVATEVTYETSGSMIVNVSSDVSERQVVDDVRKALAQMLGADEDDVEVTVKMESDELSYIITADSFEEAERIRNVLNADDVEAKISDRTDVVGIASITPNDHIKANIFVIFDGEKTTVTVKNGESLLEEAFQDEYEIDAHIFSPPNTTNTQPPTSTPTVRRSTHYPTLKPGKHTICKII